MVAIEQYPSVEREVLVKRVKYGSDRAIPKC